MRMPVETYKIVCDGCGQEFENSMGFACYCDNPNGIEDDAVDSGWLITADGHHYCDKCHTWNDEEEICECKDGKKYNGDYEPLSAPDGHETYEVSGRKIFKQMNSIMNLGFKIGALLDECGLDTCVIRKDHWKVEGSDEIHSAWCVAPCNAASEEEIKTLSEEEEELVWKE